MEFKKLKQQCKGCRKIGVMRQRKNIKNKK